MFLAARGPAELLPGLSPKGGPSPSTPSPPATAPAATIIGVPYDRTTSFRSGARFAPPAIRWASQSIESYSRILDRDLGEVAFIDAGDLPVEHLPAEQMIRATADAVAVASGIPVVLGGDHTVTVGAIQALARRYPDLRVIVLDAHLDLRSTYEGSAWSHATTVRRLTEIVPPDRVAVLGARSGTREEYQAASALLAAGPALGLSRQTWMALEGGPVYLSIDIDVVDPADAPGTGNLEPGGPRAADLLDLLRVLAPLQVVGFDVAEVSPPYDPSARTSVLAALVVREALLTWGDAPGAGGA